MYCSNCGYKNGAEDNYCCSCGVSLQKPPENLQLTTDKGKYCSKCGNQSAGVLLYCQACGISLSQAIESAPAGTPLNLAKPLLGQVKITSTQKAWNKKLPPDLIMRSLYGAAGAILIGLVLAWIGSLVMHKLLIKQLPYEAILYARFLKVNPLALLAQSHGAVFYIKAGLSAMGADITASLSMRIGLVLLMFIPFVALTVSAGLATSNLSRENLRARLEQALATGVIYGIVLTLSTKLMGSFFSLSLDKLAGVLGMDDIVGFLQYAEASGVVKSGFNFFTTLLLTILWGSLFSMIGAFYPCIKLNLSRLPDYFNIPYAGSIRAALRVFKYSFFLSVFSILIFSIFYVLPNRGYFSTSLISVIIVLLLVAGTPFALLLLNGATLRAVAYIPGVFQEGVVFSLFKGVRNPYAGYVIARPWFFPFLLLVPLILGVFGGYLSQKGSRNTPLKNALAFSACYTALSIILSFAAQISGYLDLSKVAPLASMLGEKVPGEGRLLLGFPIMATTLVIGITFFVTGLVGAYLAARSTSK